MPELEPITREEKFLNGEVGMTPITREEKILAGEDIETVTRREYFLKKYRGGGGGDITVEEITITENGTTTAPSGKAYSPIHTNVSQPTLSTLEVSENGDYDAPSGTAYNRVEVNVPLPQNAYLLKSVANLPQAIASFNDGEDMVMPSLKVAIEPQQDLHGYDSPWAGGAGKNKFPIATATSSGTQNIFTKQPLLLSAGNYVLSFNSATPTTNNMSISFFNGDTQVRGADILPGTTTVNFTFNQNITSVTWYVREVVSLSNIMIESGDTKTTFAPYSNICPISGWDEMDVTRAGENLFDATNLINDRTIDANGDLSGYGGRVTTPDYISVKPNTSICLSYSKNVSQNVVFIYALYKDGTLISRVANNPMGTVIQTENANQIRFAFYDSVSKDNLYNIQLEYGSTLTEYTPYTDSHTYTIDLDGTRYGGEVDVVSGVLTVDRASIKLSDLIWTKQNTANNNWRFKSSQSIQNIKIPTSAAYKIDNLCSVYRNVTANETWTADDTGIAINADASLLICDLNQADTTALGVVIANQTICYELATPLTIQLTPTQVKSLLGSNNVWADTGDITDAEYFSKEV